MVTVTEYYYFIFQKILFISVSSSYVTFGIIQKVRSSIAVSNLPSSA